MTIVEALKQELAHGQFTALVEIVSRNGWKMHSAEAAVRVLRREKHQYHVERKRIDNTVMVRAVPRSILAWLPAGVVSTNATTNETQVVTPPPPFFGTNRDAAPVRLALKPKRKYTRKPRIDWTIDAQAIARDIIVDVLRRNARAI